MKLGYASPAKMLSEMRPSELGAWAALWAVDPFDERRADLRTGIIASVLANVNRDPKRRSKAWVPTDFMPYAKAEDRRDSADISRKLRAAFMARRN